MSRVVAGNRDQVLARAQGYPELAREPLLARVGELVAILARSPCWWVTAAMTELALDASADLPDWSPVEAAPDPIGLLVGEAPLPHVAWVGAPDAVHTIGAFGDRRPPAGTGRRNVVAPDA